MAEILSNDEHDPDGWHLLHSHIREGMYLNMDDPFAKFMLPKPYEYSDITIREIDPNTVYPNAKYVLTSHLQELERLDIELRSQGIDMFKLRGILQINED